MKLCSGDNHYTTAPKWRKLRKKSEETKKKCKKSNITGLHSLINLRNESFLNCVKATGGRVSSN